MASQLLLPVPKDYGYVLATASATFFLLHWHGYHCMGYRKRAGIGHPNQYAPPLPSTLTGEEKAKKEKDYYLFNCAQRAMANYLENQGTLVTATLIAGLQFPITTSICGIGWCVSRVVYALGYTMESKEGGKGRLYGLPWEVFQFANIFLSAWASWSVIRGVL